MRKFLITCFIIGLTSTILRAQFKNMGVSSTAGIIAGGKEVPFLMRSNQYGIVPQQPNLAYLNVTFRKDYDRTHKTDYGFAIEPHLNAGINSQQILLPEAYIKGHWRAFDLYVGRKREIQGLVDTSGTMGSYIVSGKSLPLPKIDLGIREFIPILGKFVWIKGNFSHGWFGKGDSVQNVLLHQKSLYMKLGKPQWKIQVVGGVNHQAQWGGRPNTPFFDKISQQLITQYPQSFMDYLSVVTGVSLTDYTGMAWDEQEGVPANEAGNRMGNHLGTVDIGIDLFPIKDLKVKIYRQSVFDDGSLFYLNNIEDGLNGISLSYKDKYKLTVEYLDTRSQGGTESPGNVIPELRGRDNYFNNGMYRDAWTYKGKVIGTPLFTPYHERSDIFIVNKLLSPNYIYNNRVQAFNIKAQYQILGNPFSSQFLIYNNLGTYVFPIQKGQFSFQQTGQYSYKKMLFKARVGFDTGYYLPNNFGLDISVTRRFLGAGEW